MTPYFFATYQTKVTRKQAAEINKRIAAIDESASFVRHYAPGNDTHGWLERPNDGTNDANWRRARLAEMRAIADQVLGVVR